MRLLVGKQITAMDRPALLDRASLHAGVTVDIGTGDGKFVFREASRHPGRLFVGIDPAYDNMAESAVKAAKRARKGTLENVLFVVADAWHLPDELECLADAVHINFPWAGLLRGIVEGDTGLLDNIRRISRPEATIEILVNYSVFEEGRVPLEARDLPKLGADYVDGHLAPRYAACGIRLHSREMLSKDAVVQIPSTWAKRLGHGRDPVTIRLRGTAVAEVEDVPSTA